ncbi:MAG: hypothetical protein WAT92_23200 [Saprospiraceae bacterium]
MKTKFNFLIFIVVGFIGCGPKVTSNKIVRDANQFSNKELIHIYEIDEDIPQEADYLGNIEIGYSGFSNKCGYLTVINEAKKQAKMASANIVKITELKKPDFGNTCYRLKGDLFHVDSMVQFSTLPLDADYALVHFYRPKGYAGSLVKFSIVNALNESVVKLKNDSKFSYKIKNFGEQTLWTPSVGFNPVVLIAERGKEYYIKCDFIESKFDDDRMFTIVRNQKGKMEFESVKKLQN